MLGIQLDEQANEGEIILDLDGAMLALGDSLGQGRQLAFNVEYPSRFTGEFQAFVKDRQGRSEYGSMQIIESHDVAATGDGGADSRRAHPRHGIPGQGI